MIHNEPPEITNASKHLLVGMLKNFAQWAFWSEWFICSSHKLIQSRTGQIYEWMHVKLTCGRNRLICPFLSLAHENSSHIQLWFIDNQGLHLGGFLLGGQKFCDDLSLPFALFLSFLLISGKTTDIVSLFGFLCSLLYFKCVVSFWAAVHKLK